MLSIVHRTLARASSQLAIPGCLATRSFANDVSEATEDVPTKKKTPKVMSALNLFYKDQGATARAELGEKPNLDKDNSVPTLLDKWRNMSDEEKLPYVEQSNALKEERAKAKEAARKRPKRSPNAYVLFMSEFVKTAPSVKGTGTAMQAAATRWKSLSDEEKLPFKEKASSLAEAVAKKK